MVELSEIEKRYKEFPDERLIGLWREKSTLRSEVIPILKQEITNRGLLKEILAIDESLSEHPNYENLSLKELQLIVTDRLQAGESIESIKIHFDDYGVSMSEVINQEGIRNDQIFKYLEDSKQAGVSESIVKTKLQEEFNVEENEIKELKSQMKSRANAYTIIGGILVFISIILIAANMATDGSTGRRNSFIMLGAGILLLSKGLRQGKV